MLHDDTHFEKIVIPTIYLLPSPTLPPMEQLQKDLVFYETLLTRMTDARIAYNAIKVPALLMSHTDGMEQNETDLRILMDKTRHNISKLRMKEEYNEKKRKRLTDGIKIVMDYKQLKLASEVSDETTPDQMLELLRDRLQPLD